MSFHITEGCFNWCKEQNFIHQQNITIQDLGVISVALISLLINHVIYSHSDWILKNIEIKENQLHKIYIASSYFAFVLLALFLGYYAIFRI